MNITLKQLEALVWVVDLGSFRKAAERLNTTQPNISSRIAGLESLLQVKLMDRDAGSVRLTPIGQNVLSEARAALLAADAVYEQASAKHRLDGKLRLGVTEMVAYTWLNDFLKAFKKEYPQVHLDLTVDLAVNLDRELATNQLDLCFQSGPFETTATGELKLGAFPMVWVVTPESKLNRKKRVHLADVADQPIITHAKNTVAYNEVIAYFFQRLGTSVTISPSSNLMVATQMVEDGYGVGALLAPLVEKSLNEKRLVKLDLDWRPSALEFFARYDADRATSVVKTATLLAEKLSLNCALRFS